MIGSHIQNKAVVSHWIYLNYLSNDENEIKCMQSAPNCFHIKRGALINTDGYSGVLHGFAVSQIAFISHGRKQVVI